MHSGAQASSMLFGNTGDQIGRPRESQRSRKAAANGNDLTFQPQQRKHERNMPVFPIPLLHRRSLS
jgi:hypothetical protein